MVDKKVTTKHNIGQGTGHASIPEDTIVMDASEVNRETDSMQEGVDTVGQNIEERMARRKSRRGPGVFTWICIAVVALIAVTIFSFSSFFTVESIEVEGNTYYTDDEIVAIAHLSAGSNIWHDVKRRTVIGYLEDDPYIIDAKMSRTLPGTVRITIEDRKQIGALVYGDQFLVIDENGMLLRVTETQPKITIITGLKVNKIEKGDTLGVEDDKMFSDTLGLIDKMDKSDMYFTALDMGELYDRAYIYDSLVCIGTTEQLMEAMDEGRLQQILTELFNKGIKRGTIRMTDEGYASFSPEVDSSDV